MNAPQFSVPVTHFRTPGTRNNPACNPYVDVYVTHHHPDVTCMNCRRTWVFKNHLKELSK